MIESIYGVNYEPYTAVSNSSNTAKYKNEAIPEVFDLQEILKSLEEYTYSQEDVEYIDENTINDFKKKFNIEENDIYKLKKYGYDLERLYTADMSYYTSLYNTEGTHGIPADVNNSSKVNQLGEKIDIIKKQNDNMYLYSLYAKDPITINSLYQSNYKGNFQKSKTSYSEQDITKILEMNGLTSTKGNMWAAGKLAEYGMAINKNDVVKLQNMKSAVECLDKQEEFDKAQEDIACGKEPGERPLIKDGQVIYDPEEIKAIKEELGQVKDADIEELIINDEEITINNLRITLFKNTDLALKRNSALSFTEGQRKTANDIKEQIHHIRTHLTAQAAQKISEKMPLESSQLSDIVQELKKVESETITQAVKEADIPLSEENITIIQNVMHVRQEIIENRAEALELEIVSNEQIKLNEIHEALTKYAQNETPVESRFGESIRTVENQIEQLLQTQNIIPTEETVQAAKALVMNHMEVNPENIKQALDIMVKVNTFIEEMTPTRAATLIKEGLNPYQASIDTLLSWISKETVEQLKSSIAETIVALQEKGIISSEQKDALIGFYRIMQAVNNNREEVVGYLFKNNLPLTVEKLQEAAKYIGEDGIIEAAIDDGFGEIKELKVMSQTAKMILEESKEQIHKGIDIVQMLEQMELPITDKNIEKLKKINALLYPLIKETFKKELGKFEGMETLPKSFLEKLEVIKKVDPQVVSYMLRLGISPTVSNIYWADRLFKSPDTYKELLKEGELIQENLPKSLEAFEEELEHQEEQATKSKEAALEKGNILAYRTYKQIEEVIHLQKELSQKDGVYQMPFMIQGEEKMVHLYFNKKPNKQLGTDASTTAVMTYDTKNLGTITAYINFKEEDISYKVQGETEEITKKLQANNSFLDQLLGQIGYLVKYSEYASYTNDEQVNNKPSLIKRGSSDFEEIV
ncbi:DUF6240 domain-containing protein [Cellulosilyticum sp. I15G10I2]|uniref:DUF6240 domain-containing protein n=1 Tax=Cellulosilyticum sp. I15G10I2 TaxID=1892843 RepID=UPI00085CD9DF|nr:DUF6240 domain-containing protein [Cellulosilyticum sp. I15G10I2]